MTTNRELLDLLGRATLVRLMRERDLTPTRENEQRRKALAHSFRGDVRALVVALLRQELVDLFKNYTFDLQGVESCVSNPAKYRLEELQAFALCAFAGRRVRIPADFVPVVSPDSDSESASGMADQETKSSGVRNDIEDGDTPSLAEALGVDGHAWSRPRMIGRLLEVLGHEPLQRLRAARFRELITQLIAEGLEACLADDPAATPLTADDESPGIEAKLRLRRAIDARGGNKQKPERQTTAEQDAGPRITVSPGEKPVQVHVAKPSDYNLAVLRLQFLTAVPSAERRSLSAWPGGYLAAATNGLTLRQQEVALLRAYAAGLCMGNHNPYDAIPRLSQILSSTEWESLLTDFQALNPFQPELVQAIIAQVAPVTPPQGSTSKAGAGQVQHQPADFEAKGRALSPESRAAAGARTPLAPETAQPTAPNKRDLGALAGMFDED